MKSFIDKMLEQLAKHGLVVMLLAVSTYVFWTQNNRCNNQIIEIYQEQNERMIRTLDKNTEILDRNTEVMENLSTLLKKN